MSQDAAQIPPAIPTGRELYDAIMGHIEPELATAAAATLAEKYKDESASERAARMQRYELAFDQYNRAYEEYIETLQTQVTRYRKNAMTHAEYADREREGSALSSIIQAFQAA